MLLLGSKDVKCRPLVAHTRGCVLDRCCSGNGAALPIPALLAGLHPHGMGLVGTAVTKGSAHIWGRSQSRRLKSAK